MTCLSQLPGSLFTQTTWPSCTLQKTGSRCRELSRRTWQPYRYLRKWKLKLSRPITKTVTAAFHLYHKEAASELKVASEGRILPFPAEPTCLGIEMDRSLTFRRHLESLRKKLTTRVAFLRRLVGQAGGLVPERCA